MLSEPAPKDAEAALREAFKAGWRTNAVVPEDGDDAAYSNGCEHVDWLEYRRLGITAYLLSLIPEEVE